MTIGIWTYIEGIRCTVLDLNQRVVKAEENIVAIRELISRWKDKPMFERIHEERTEPLLNIEGTFTIVIIIDLIVVLNLNTMGNCIKTFLITLPYKTS